MSNRIKSDDDEPIDFAISWFNEDGTLTAPVSLNAISTLAGPLTIICQNGSVAVDEPTKGKMRLASALLKKIDQEPSP